MTPDERLEYQALVGRHDTLQETPEPMMDFSWERVKAAGDRAMILSSLRKRIIELERQHPELRHPMSPDSVRGPVAASSRPVAPRLTHSGVAHNKNGATYPPGHAHSGVARNKNGAPYPPGKPDPNPVSQQTRNPATQRKRRLSLTNPAFQASYIEAKIEEEARKKDKGTVMLRKPQYKRSLTLGEMYERSREEAEWAFPSQRAVAEEKEQAKVKSERILTWLENVEPTKDENPEVMRRKRTVVFGNMEEQTIEFSGFRGEGESV
jgi:hypothetical protein